MNNIFLKFVTYNKLKILIIKLIRMKKYILVSICLFTLFSLSAQKAAIQYEEKIFDFGKINEEGGKVTHVFKLKNVGSAPLVISQVRASCGCTTPEWTKEPIEPGKTGTVTVTYNPAGRPGPFTKTITVTSNATEEQTTINIKGEVIGKSATPTSQFLYPLGKSLAANLKVVQMNNVDKGKEQIRVVEIKNTSSEPADVAVFNLPAYITATVSPAKLKPNEEGKITFAFNSAKCKTWGPVSNDVYVAVNGQKKKSDDLKIVVFSNVVENFGSLSTDQKRNAPILEISNRNVDLGVIANGLKKTAIFSIKNNGKNNLEIRRIVNSNKELIVHGLKSVSGGKKSELKVDVNSENLASGDYKRVITIQTNDPDNSFLILAVSWKIQK